MISGNQIATINKFGIRVADYFGLAASLAPVVSDNLLGMNEGNISIAYTSKALVTRNTILASKGYGVGIGQSSDAEVSYNTIQNLTISDDGSLYNGIDINVNSLRGLAHHNVVIGVAYFSITLEDALGQPSNDWVVRNNIFDARTNTNPTSPGDVVGAVMIMPTVTRYTFFSNDYVPNANHVNQLNRFHGVDSSFASWSSDVGDQGSISTDPLFVNATNGDVTLQSGSACLAVDCGRLEY